MTIIKNINLGLRFILEVISIVAISYWGFHIQQSTFIRYAVGIGVPLLVIVIWGIFGAPKAIYRLQGIYRLILQLVIFGSATVALFFAYGHRSAIVFGVTTAVSISLFYIWKQQP